MNKISFFSKDFVKCWQCNQQIFEVLNFGFWILDFGFWILDFGFWILRKFER